MMATVNVTTIPRAQQGAYASLIVSVRRWLEERCVGELPERWDPLGDEWPGDKVLVLHVDDQEVRRQVSSAPVLRPEVNPILVHKVRSALLQVIFEYGNQWTGPVSAAQPTRRQGIAAIRAFADEHLPAAHRYVVSLDKAPCGTVGTEVAVDATSLAREGAEEVARMRALATELCELWERYEGRFEPLRPSALHHRIYDSAGEVPINRMCALLLDEKVDSLEIAKIVGFSGRDPEGLRDRVKQRAQGIRNKIRDAEA